MINKNSKEAETNSDFIKFFANIVENSPNKNNGANAWWELSAKQILNKPVSFLFL